jgi:hypothetical protein
MDAAPYEGRLAATADEPGKFETVPDLLARHSRDADGDGARCLEELLKALSVTRRQGFVDDRNIDAPLDEHSRQID